MSIIQPSKIIKPLYAHQLVSIANMLKLEKNKKVDLSDNRIVTTKIGILSDLTGYGKTLSILGLIAYDPVWDVEGGTYVDSKKTGTDILSHYDYETYEKYNCNLVILNSVLLTQWESELKHTKLTYKKVVSRKDIDTVDISGSNILLCDYTYFNLLRSRFSKISWKRIIVDEPNTIKLAENKMISNFIWFVTATPYELLEKEKYPTILGTPTYATFNSIIIKNPDDFVRKSFEMPPNTVINYMCTNIIHQILKGNIQKNVEELINADNIKGVLEYLGAGKDTLQNIVDLIYQKKLSKIQELEKMIDIKNSEKLKARYQTLKSEILTLDQNFRSALEKNPCPICLENFKSPSIVTCCQNIFCAKCITSTVLTNSDKNVKCPLCRHPITLKNVICINLEIELKDNLQVGKLTKPKTKSQTIISIISENIKGKYIIYSDYIESFDTLKRYMQEKNINYAELKGLKSQRERNLESYKNGDVNVLLLTTLQYSAGIDLVNTSDIILYHEMDDSVKTQIIGRANRIGRKIPLKIHNMV